MEDHCQIKLISNRTNDIAWVDVDSISKLILLLLHFQDHCLDRLLGWLAAFCNEVGMLLIIKQRCSVKYLAVLIQQCVNLLVDRLFSLHRIQAWDTGQEADIIVYKSLSGHGELFSISL